jgi:hypothetical protein
MNLLKPLFTFKSLAALIFLASTASLSAPAHAGWTYLSLRNNVVASEYHWARVCTIPRSGGYGPVWEVKLQVNRKYLRPSQIIMAQRFRNNTLSDVVNSDKWHFDGHLGLLTIYASRLDYLGDTVQFSGSNQFISNRLLFGTGTYRPAFLANCVSGPDNGPI